MLLDLQQLFRFTQICPNLNHDALDVGAALASGQREPELPSAHRTVRTGPYTAPHARRIH